MIPIDSACHLSFILEHIMNKWAGNGFTKNPLRQNNFEERRMTGARMTTLAQLRGSIERIETHSDTYAPDRVSLRSCRGGRGAARRARTWHHA